MVESEAEPQPFARQGPTSWVRFYRWLTPIRLLCFALLGLAGYGLYVLGPMAVLLQLILIPGVAIVTDALLAYVRWHSFRFPWAGLATGLFVALLIPPQGAISPLSDVTILLGGAVVTVAALLAKHVFRTRNHPWFNPAAFALVLAGVIFGITPAWWGAISVAAVLIAGAAIALRQPRRWPIPVAFFASYSVLTIAGNFITLGPTGPSVIVLDLLDPSLLFFTLLMLTEPRTSVANPVLQPAFGLAAGLLAGLLRLAAGVSAFAASENLLLALLGANLIAVVLRAVDANRRAERAPAREPARRAREAPRPRPTWGWGHTAGVALVLLLLIGVSWGIAGQPAPVPAGPPPKVTVVSCTQDNRTIPSADLSMLHQRLGPSVIFSYDRATGTTLFYDPANRVTIYETDLFEDFGNAEFNGDDQILANGCSLGAA